MIELIVWCILGLGGWWWLLRRTPGGIGGQAPPGGWHAGDAVFAAIIALWVIFLVMADKGKHVALTPEMIQGGILDYVIFIGLFLAIAFRWGLTPVSAYGLRPSSPLRAVAMGVVCILMTFPLVQVAEEIVGKFGRSASEGDEMVRYLHGQLSTQDIAWAAILIVIVAPLTEELAFRGYLYGVIRKYAGPIGAMLTSALLFAALHHNLPAMPALFILGIGLALAYEVTGSLWTPIVMHMLFNLVPLVVILYFPQWIPKF